MLLFLAVHLSQSKGARLVRKFLLYIGIYGEPFANFWMNQTASIHLTQRPFAKSERRSHLAVCGTRHGVLFGMFLWSKNMVQILPFTDCKTHQC
jgi:hypothetical protein